MTQLTFFKSTKLQLLIIVLLSGLVYSNIFQNQLVIDDKTFIVNWETKNSLINLPKLLSGEVPLGHEGVYRPLRSVLYAFYYQIFGTNPFGYHLHGLITHLLATFLVYLITKLVMSSWFIVHRKKSTNYELPARPAGGPTTNYQPFITALLFGVHPIHTETITYISSSMDTLGIVFMLLSFYLYIKVRERREIREVREIWVSIFFGFLAFFTFEVTLVLPLLLILYEFLFRVKGKGLRVKGILMSLLPYFAGVGSVLFIRFFLLQVGQRGPYLGDSIYLTFLTMTKVFVKYLSLLIWPMNLANNHTISSGIEAFVYRDYREEAIMAQSIFDLQIILSIVVIVTLLIVAWKLRKKLPIITFSIAWFFICLLPVSEIIPQGSMLNERFLYLPSFGFVLLLGYSVQLTAYRFKKHSLILFVTCLLSLVSFYSYQTYQRNRDWVDNISLWTKDIQVYPKENAYAYYQLGNAYFEKGEYELAINNYQKSSQISPKFAVSMGSVGLVYEKLGQNSEAIRAYQQAIVNNPNFWEGYLKLRDIYLKEGKEDLANQQYQKYLELFSK